MASGYPHTLRDPLLQDLCLMSLLQRIFDRCRNFRARPRIYTYTLTDKLFTTCIMMWAALYTAFISVILIKFQVLFFADPITMSSRFSGPFFLPFSGSVQATVLRLMLSSLQRSNLPPKGCSSRSMRRTQAQKLCFKSIRGCWTSPETHHFPALRSQPR